MLAAVGMRAVISRKVERITRAQLEEMNTLPRDLTKAARALADGEANPIKYEKVKYRDTLKDLARGWEVEQVADMVAQFPVEYHATGQTLVVKSIQLINAMLKEYPVTSYQTVAGSDQLSPSDTRMFRFISVLEVLDQPLMVFDLMAQGAILQSQVKAMRLVYPSMSAAIDAALFDAVSRKRADKKSFQLPTRAEYGVKAWFGKGPVSTSTLARAQATIKDSQLKQEASKPVPDQSQDQKLMTQAEKSAAL